MANEVKPLERLAHFHRVDDCIYYYAVEILHQVLSNRLRAGQQSFTTTLTNSQFDTLYAFLDELGILYEHPRACSKRWRAFWKERDENRSTVTSTDVERQKARKKNR